MEKRISSISLKIRVILLSFGAIWLTLSPAIADEFGFTGGLLTFYSGSIDVGAEDEKPLENSGTPYQIYSLLGNIRIAFMHYEQYAQHLEIEKSSALLYTVSIKNDVLLLMYQDSFFPKNEKYYDFETKTYNDPDPDDSSIDIYWNVGVGLFNSSMDWNNCYFKTDGDFNVGFSLGVGAKKIFENTFIGLELLYLNKTQYFHTTAYTYDFEVNIGGAILSLTTGIKI
ncbi:hypothetical protein KJ966_21555 [bacterium]|nr:hypothetical protein [bacterium]